MNKYDRRENRGSTHLSINPVTAYSDVDPVWCTGVMGFRLAYDGECRLFTGCVHGCKEPGRRLSTYHERGDWKAHGVGFRLTLDREKSWQTK